MEKYYVYILYSRSLQQFYKGQTKDLGDRLSRHNGGREKWTAKGTPWQLLWQVEKPSRGEALKLEKKLKNLSRRRTMDFILKYEEGVSGPDELKLVLQLSGC